MDIESRSGYLIIMDPRFLQLAKAEKISAIDFTGKPGKAARLLEESLFQEDAGSKIGLIPLPDGPGVYDFIESKVSFWDVENTRKSGRTVFGVELASYVIFDIEYIKDFATLYDESKLKKTGEKKYISSLNRKLSKNETAIIWRQSMVGIGDGWHEISWSAFKKSTEE